MLTVGEEDNPETAIRASRVDDDFIQAELCNETHTYCLRLYANGEVVLDRIGKRWNDAQEAKDNEWEDLFFYDGEHIEEVSDGSITYDAP